MRRLGIILVVAGLAARPSALAAGPDVASQPRIAVVVVEKSEVTRVTLDDLRELYLRRRRRWPSGAPAIPINLPPDHLLRERFSKVVLGRSPADLVSYWDARYFEGTIPPAVLSSSEAVRTYLAAEPGAIGYLAMEDARGACRVVLVLEP